MINVWGNIYIYILYIYIYICHIPILQLGRSEQTRLQSVVRLGSDV